MDENRKYSILLIEPSPIVRTGLSILIEQCRNFRVASTLSDLSHYKKINTKSYDIIIINPIVINYDQRTDIRALMSVTKEYIIAISYTPYEENIMYQYDGSIYIYDNKELIQKKLKSIIEEGRHYIKSSGGKLSERERSILAAVAEGKTNKEIADQFNLSVYTVISHRKKISLKLGINTISGLTVYAVLNKLIDVKDF